MAKKQEVIWSTVVRSVRVPVDFDHSRRDDDDYIEEKEDEIAEKASKEFGCSPKDLMITDSDIPDLIN